MKSTLKNILSVIAVVTVALGLHACSYKKTADAAYPSSAIYMPTGVAGNYEISAVAVPGQTFRYAVDVTAGKFNVPLSVYRGGLDAKGSIAVNVAIRTDTVSKLITNGTLTGAELLPADKYTIPTSASIADGASYAPFSLSVDLNFLLANPTKTYAIAVAVTSGQIANTTKNITVVVIKPAFLIPTADFTTSVDASSSKRINFNNTSLNGASFLWNYGDGTPTETVRSPSHTYAAAGSYTVTLTTTGAAGTKVVKTLSISVL